MARDDDDDDDDRPFKKKRVERDDVRTRTQSRAREDDGESDVASAGAKAMPLRLMGAIAVTLAWSLLMLNANCLYSGNGVLGVIEISKMQRQQREALEKMRAAGFNPPGANDMHFQTGLPYTMLGTRIFLLLMAALLLGGGMVLLLGKGFGKYLAIGAPVGMVLVELIGLGVCLIVTRGTFLAQHNVEFLVTIFLSLVVAGCNGYLLMSKEVSRALR